MLQVGGADTVEDIQCPALEVGEHDVRTGQPLIDVGACRRAAGKMTITGALEAAVALPAVGLHNAAGGDRGARRLWSPSPSQTYSRHHPSVAALVAHRALQ